MNRQNRVDIIYFNGFIYTADIQNSVCEALAVSHGYICAVGDNRTILAMKNESTQLVDLENKMMMPGIIDGHLHTFWGGKQLLSCNLNYACLTIEQTLTKIQAHLDKDIFKNETDWLQVRSWLRQGMIPAGTDLTRFDLDTLDTIRPIIVFSNDCHTLVANSRALTILDIDENTPEPVDGKIGRDETGRLNGILEDAPAMRAFDSIKPLTKEQAVELADLVQRTFNRQGVTTVMDTRVFAEQLDAFVTLREHDRLTLRVQGAREITPPEETSLDAARIEVKKVHEFASKYNLREWMPAPDVAVKHVKFFVDGVLQSPLMTASLFKPYLHNVGTNDAPDWQLTENCGDLYFSQEMLDSLILAASEAGYHPHMHTVAEGGIEITLNAIEKMRQALPNKDIRPALAHNEMVAPHQFSRIAALQAIPVLSLQWAGLTDALIQEEKGILGADRFEQLEPAGRFIDAGGRIAFGSDWPIDAFNEWYDFKVALTRRATFGDKQGSRLDTDRNLTIIEVLRAATIDSAYALGQDAVLGSLEAGKFADFIVLDRNVMQITPEEVEQTHVVMTIVGGKVVYQQ